MKTIFLSKKGFKELRREISELESKERKMIATLHDINKKKTHDDRLQRSEIIMNLENTQSQLAMKRDASKQAKPLPRKRDRLRVALGSVVDLVDQKGRLFRYTIVDGFEANPLDGRISMNSPLGKSLMNKKQEDTISWNNGFRVRRLRLVDIY